MRMTGIGGLALAAAAAALVGAPREAQAFDMDCKVILRMAGGFPAGCSDAYATMIDRITARPPKPPVGVCATSDGRAYTDHEVAFSRPSGRRAYRCPAGSQLRYHVEHVQEEGTRREVFCYTHATTREERCGHDCEREAVVYHGRSTPRRVDYRLRLTLEPGTAAAWRSGLIEGNRRTGEVWRTGGDHPAPPETATPATSLPGTGTLR